MDAGHEARLLADRSTLSSAYALGVPCGALSGDIRQALMPGEALSIAVHEKGGFNRTAKALAEIANTHTSAWMREVLDATEGCDAIIVSGLAAFVGLSVAECRGIKAIGAGLIPITPTGDFPSPFLPPAKVPHWLNRASHRLVNGLLWQAFRKKTNAARASVCGQWNMPVAAWTPPQDLGDFLAAGEAPLYVGFGSMAGFDRRNFLDTLINAVGGRRALFYPGWSGMETATLPKNFFKIGEVPHHWLFPRTALVVHHGGAGTTHSAARAGVPSVVLPFAGDQFFWAHRLWQLGVAAAPVRGKSVGAAELRQSIDAAARDDVRVRARELGLRMAGEDGLGTAVAAIEGLLRG